jgi:magnesium transporter
MLLAVIAGGHRRDAVAIHASGDYHRRTAAARHARDLEPTFGNVRARPMLVNCVAYQEGRKLADISKEDISEYLKQPGCFVWVALKDPSPAELDEMREEFSLHELAADDARSGHQRPKIEEYGDSLFAVLHMIEPHEGELHVGEVDIFVGSNYVLSVRVRSERGFTDVRHRSEREPHLLQYGLRMSSMR